MHLFVSFILEINTELNNSYLKNHEHKHTAKIGIEAIVREGRVLTTHTYNSDYKLS